MTNTRGDYSAYIRWANRAVTALSPLVSTEDIDRLVLTRRYWLLQSMAPHAGTPEVISLLNAEFDLQWKLFDETQRALQGRMRRWPDSVVLFVADTSYYINSPTEIDAIDLSEHISWKGQPALLLLPMVVVDELDGLKDRGQNDARRRARRTLAILDKRLERPSEIGILNRPSGPDGSDAVSVEIMFDPPGHARLPIIDDEIVDRAVTAQLLADRSVTFLTFDTGQSMRARAAGLDVVKFPPPDR